MNGPFDFADVAGPAAALRALPATANDRLAERVQRGESPLAAAAELVRRGDDRGLRALAGAVAFALPEELAALATVPGAVGADALACVALASWLPLPSRQAAAEALARAPATARSYAALAELAAAQKPMPQAVKALAEVTPRAAAVRDEAERLRAVAKQMRDGVRGVIHRQEHQRKVAAGELPAALGLLVGDEGEFLAGIVPPIADGAREALLPALVALLRSPVEARRQRALALLQRRWREVAGAAVSCAARTPAKAKEAAAALAAVKALAGMGAHDELVATVAVTSGAVRAAAIAELEKAVERGATDIDARLLSSALERVGPGTAKP